MLFIINAFAFLQMAIKKQREKKNFRAKIEVHENYFPPKIVFFLGPNKRETDKEQTKQLYSESSEQTYIGK